MNNLRKLIRFFCLQYPIKNELSKARLTKMIYLSDWFSAQKNEQQLTEINWLFDHYGPYVNDVINDAYEDPLVDVLHTSTYFGTPKVLIQAKSGLIIPEMDEITSSIANKVISETKHLTFKAFIDFVYNTYPIKTANRYSHLNLIDLAKLEKRELYPYSNEKSN